MGNFDLSSICTPVNVEVFGSLLKETSYPMEETNYLIQGFTEGFSIGFEGPRDRVMESNNLKLRVGTRQDLWDKVVKEVKLGRFAGPYVRPPFTHYVQSPIGLVPKHTPGQTRLIYHLSYPQGESINDYIPKDKCSVKYQDLDAAIQMILEEKGEVFLASSDFSSAFRHVPLNPADFHLLVMKASHPQSGRVFYFVEKALSFGCGISCALFTRVSNAIAHIVMVRNQKRLNPYLDDFLFCNSSVQSCNSNLQGFLQVCSMISFPVSSDKTVYATQLIEFLGMLLDAVRRLLLIPVEKRDRALTQIDRILGAKKILMHDLQRLTGLLNFLCRAIVPGRAFTRRFYFYMRGLKQHHHLRVNTQIRKDLKVWKAFLTEPIVSIARPFMDFNQTLQADVLEFFTDASKRTDFSGFGCYFRPQWTWGQFPQRLVQDYDLSICFLELYAVCVAVELWTHRLKNKRVVIFCDNQAVVAMINKSSSSCPKCMGLIRMMVYTSMYFNTRYFARYIPTDDNNLADALSRQQLDRFWQHAPQDTHAFPRDLPESACP